MVSAPFLRSKRWAVSEVPNNKAELASMQRGAEAREYSATKGSKWQTLCQVLACVKESLSESPRVN